MMTNEKLNVDRCWNANAPDVDDLACHRWRALPYIEMTEHGPIAWHCCERCPARALHDPETEDGFEPEPAVVYPPSCFEIAVCTYHARGARHCLNGCGCPAKASGETVHHDGCAELQANVEAIARAGAPELPSIPGVESRRLEDGRVSFRAVPYTATAEAEIRMGVCRVSNAFRRTCPGCMLGQHQPEPAAIVHPPTDPAPPSEELKQAMAESEAANMEALFGDPWLPEDVVAQA